MTLTTLDYRNERAVQAYWLGKVEGEKLRLVFVLSCQANPANSDVDYSRQIRYHQNNIDRWSKHLE